jgi:hypothetical protein
MNASWTSILGGSGVGLLLGMVVGLSSSPVVGAVVGALAAGLLALLGLKEKDVDLTAVQCLRLGCFGFACCLGVVIGLWLRTSDRLSPRLTEQQQQWKAIGFSDDETRKIVLYRSTGLLLEPLKIEAISSVSGGKTATSLFSVSSGSDICTASDASQFASTSEQVKALKQSGGSFGRLADSLQGLKSADQKHILEVINHWACGS